MTAFDFSINLLTLLAMVIAVGLVVDDAIVVVENITRYVELGHSKRQAVLEGSANIAITIVGLTFDFVSCLHADSIFRCHGFKCFETFLLSL